MTSLLPVWRIRSKSSRKGPGSRNYCAEIYAEVVPEKLRWLQAVRALASTTPSPVAYFSSSRLRQRIKEAARRISCEAVIVHCAFAAQYGLGIPAKFRLLDFGDLDSGKWLDYSKWRSCLQSWAYYLEGYKLRRYEKQTAAAFNYCTLTTQGELEEFKKLKVDRPHNVIVEILTNPQLRFTFSNAGGEQVNSAHVWSRSMEVLDNIFMESRV